MNTQAVLTLTFSDGATLEVRQCVDNRLDPLTAAERALRAARIPGPMGVVKLELVAGALADGVPASESDWPGLGHGPVALVAAARHHHDAAELAMAGLRQTAPEDLPSTIQLLEAFARSTQACLDELLSAANSLAVNS